MTGARKREKRVVNNVVAKEKKSVVEYIVSHKEFITIILGLCAVLYPLLNMVYKNIYQNRCEKFYGIPGKYFDSTIDNRLLYLLCIIILLLISLAPAFMKRYYEKNENLKKGFLVEAIFLSIVIGMEIGCFNVLNLVEIMKQTHKRGMIFQAINNWLNDNAYFTIIAVTILGSFSVLTITLIENLKNIKWKWIRNIISIVLILSLMASIMLMLYGTLCKLSISVEDKTMYEFVTYDDEFVVLSSVDEKILMVPFEIDENGQYIFKTNQYFFGKKYDGIYQYRNIKYSPIINTHSDNSRK